MMTSCRFKREMFQTTSSHGSLDQLMTLSTLVLACFVLVMLRLMGELVEPQILRNPRLCLVIYLFLVLFNRDVRK